MHRTRLTRIAAVAVASALVLVGLVAAPAQASGLARITGTVVAAETGRPVGTGQVIAMPTVDTADDYVGSFGPGFSFQLTPGRYRLTFESDNTGAVNSVSPWYYKGATSLATTIAVTVKAGQTLNVGKITIAAGASVSGARPIRTEVYAFGPDGTILGRSGNPPGTSTAYDIRGLRAGTYEIGALSTSETFAAYWEDSRTLAGATAVTVATGESREGIDISPDPLARISGTLSAPASGGGTGPGYANVFLMNADTGERVPNVNADLTEFDGSWSLVVPPGRYKLWFRVEPYLSGPAASAWYGGSDRSTATVVEVGDANVTGLDATLVRAGTARVTVTGETGIVDVTLYRHDADGSWYSMLGGAGFDSEHRYGWPDTGDWDAVPPGEYTVRYHYQTTELDPLSPPMFLGGASDPEHAQTFTVASGAQTAVTVAVADAPYRPGLRDIDGDGNNDLLVRNSLGHLIVAYGDGHGGIRSKAVLTTTIPKTTRVLFGGDFSRGGDLDILALTPAGALERYWNLTGAWHHGQVTPAPYWKGTHFLAATDDFTGDGQPDLLSLDADGRIAICHGHRHGAGCSWTYLSGTWNSLTGFISPGDFDGDGHADLLARDAASRLWLFRGDGHGAFIAGRTLVTTGWAALPALSPGDFNGDGHPDVVVRDKAGTMWLYPGDGAGHLLPRTKIITGWGSLGLVA